MTTLEENVTRNDAFVTAGDGVAVDVPTLVIAMLREEWKPENTDGKVPNIEFGEHTKGVNFRNNDWVVIWSLPEQSEPVTITHQWTNERMTLQIETFTRHSRSHANRFIGELRRIIENNRNDPFENLDRDNVSGRSWMQWRTINVFDTISKGWYRRQAELEIRWRFREMTA